MKNNFYYFGFMFLLIGVMLQGFQCGSPEFTGAKVQEQNKNFREAAKLYEKELQKNPSNHEAWYRLGRIRGEELNDFDGMMAAFHEAEKLSPSYTNEIRVYRYKAWADHINAGVAFKKRVGTDSVQYYDSAIEEYQKAAKIWPDTSLTYVFLTDAYQGKGDIDNAIASQRKVWELDHDIEAYKNLGRFMVQVGMSKKERFQSENADGLRIEKNLKEIDKGSYKSDVMRMFGAPDSQKKDKKNLKREEWKYNQYALTLTLEGEKVVGKKIDKAINLKIDSSKYKEAIVQFNNAVNVFEEIKKVNPKDNENLNLLLQAYYEANRIKEATTAFKLAVDNDPENKMNHYILGLLERMVDDYEGAIKEFNAAVKIDPNFSDAFYDIGATYYNWGVKMKKEAQEKGDESKAYKKKFEEALPWMKQVIELKTSIAKEEASKESKDWRTQIKPEDIKIWDTMGTIYALLGQSENAMKALDEADKIRKAAK
jgi:tetratricopeptide (TPR) repeat protein